jgi:2-amino-4-hydroxy-6-hydroxymethyldihydropteridine diphosphokinase
MKFSVSPAVKSELFSDLLEPETCSPKPVVVAIALGSNLGDRDAHLAYAVSRLKQGLQAVRVSDVIETDPVGVGPQPKFLNAGIVGLFGGTPRELLDLLLAIERERGRERPFPGAARTLDVDLVLFGDRVVTEPGLHVPHPRFRERSFVLQPLAEIAPDLVDPVTGRTVGDMLRRLGKDGKDEPRGSEAQRPSH